MQKSIQPKYSATKISCACGAVLETGDVKENIEVEICSQCHPFYTGKKKLLDATGRVDRFKKISEKVAKKQAEKKDGEKAAKKQQSSKKSLSDLKK